jgi:outer membrane lipoprotein-sorting protein
MVRASLRKGLSWLEVILVLAAPACSWAAAEDPLRIVDQMRSSYARLSDYQMLVDSSEYRGEGVAEETRLLYRYKKPGKIRIDFIHPRNGWTLVYPSEEGRVLLRPSGVLGFLKLSLSPDNSLLTVWPGQQVTQTDLGLLIEHIGRSLTDQRLGPVEVTQEEGDLVTIQVEAENHFLEGVNTRYEFFIDAKRWLPVEVSEEIPERGRRRIRFRDLQVDLNLPDTLFEMP